MATSEKKIASNRTNAQRSTGPKTEEGKESMKLNALKYGVYAQDVLISRGDGKEDEAELEDLAREYIETFDPIGPMEHQLVMTLVTTQWRLRRIHRAEVGEARLRLDNYTRDHEWQEADRIDAAVSALVGASEPSPFTGFGPRQENQNTHRNTLFRTAAGVTYLIDLLSASRRTVERTGDIDWETCRRIQAIFEQRAVELCRVLALDAGVGESDGTEDDPIEDDSNADSEDLGESMEPEAYRQLLLRELGQELRRLNIELKALEEGEAFHGEAQRARFAIPAQKIAEQLARAERGLENQRYRALEQLERLQQQRRDRAS